MRSLSRPSNTDKARSRIIARAVILIGLLVFEGCGPPGAGTVDFPKTPDLSKIGGRPEPVSGPDHQKPTVRPESKKGLQVAPG